MLKFGGIEDFIFTVMGNERTASNVCQKWVIAKLELTKKCAIQLEFFTYNSPPRQVCKWNVCKCTVFHMSSSSCAYSGHMYESAVFHLGMSNTNFFITSIVTKKN
jgi:hypothetical protein